jgi:hypothetical protein
MEPVALTMKQRDEELMLVHVCCGCGKISKNRLAGDDNQVSILNLFDSYVGNIQHIQQQIGNDIAICADKERILRILEGF